MKKTGLLILLSFFAVSWAYSSVDRKDVKLRIQDTTSHQLDETLVYFDIGTSTNFVSLEDAPKNFDTTLAKPQILSLTSDNVSCYSNGYGNFPATVVVPLGIRVEGGVYIFSASLIDGFDPTTMVLLEDRATGVYTNLRASAYTISINQFVQGTGRFFLHVSYPPQLNTTPAGCSNNDGMVSVSEDTSITWTACGIYDSSMNLVSNYSNINGNINFSGLSEGSYHVIFSYGVTTVTKNILLTGNQISVAINASMMRAFVGQTINFTSTARNTTYYDWDFGDGTLIGSVANPDYFYYEPGVYTVQLKCSNSFGCVGYDSVSITVLEGTGIQSVNTDAIGIIAANKTLRITSAGAAESNFNFGVYDITGQLLQSGPVTSPDFNVNLNMLSSGIYIISVKNNSSVYSKKIFIK